MPQIKITPKNIFVPLVSNNRLYDTKELPQSTLMFAILTLLEEHDVKIATANSDKIKL